MICVIDLYKVVGNFHLPYSIIMKGKMMIEQQYMRRAISLAKKGVGHVNPNPLVGAVIVKDNKIIGEGYHEKFGGLHAERNALASCQESAQEATIYVTLEPCCHYGKTPPCTEAIIESGIKRVVIGSRDPNPLVAGKGARILREHGIEVVEDFLREECDAINSIFFHYIQYHTPYVAMKYAMTLDGKIACYTGKSKWVTGEAARAEVQKLRNQYMGIMVGIGTVITDDPLLTCRIEGGRNPIRILCDTRLQVPFESQIVRTAKEFPTVIATAEADGEKVQKLQEYGCTCLSISKKDGHLDLTELMKVLGERGIDSILLEGGGTLNWAALQSGIVKKAYSFISPKFFGGKDAKTPVEGMGIPEPPQAFLFKPIRMQTFDDDFCIESEVVSNCSLES